MSRLSKDPNLPFLLYFEVHLLKADFVARISLSLALRSIRTCDGEVSSQGLAKDECLG